MNDTAGIGAVMSEAEIQQWIDACNHEPARAALRELLAARQEIARLTEKVKFLARENRACNGRARLNKARAEAAESQLSREAQSRDAALRSTNMSAEGESFIPEYLVTEACAAYADSYPDGTSKAGQQGMRAALLAAFDAFPPPPEPEAQSRDEVVERALDAAAYYVDRLRIAHSGKPVRDLEEAGAAYYRLAGEARRQNP